MGRAGAGREGLGNERERGKGSENDPENLTLSEESNPGLGALRSQSTHELHAPLRGAQLEGVSKYMARIVLAHSS